MLIFLVGKSGPGRAGGEVVFGFLTLPYADPVITTYLSLKSVIRTFRGGFARRV